MWWDRSKPVSYTHLDVYKRQMYGINVIMLETDTAQETIQTFSEYCIIPFQILVQFTFLQFTDSFTNHFKRFHFNVGKRKKQNGTTT